MENILVSEINLDVNYLEHHGVKGMKWGVRKDDRSSGSARSARRRQATIRRIKKSIDIKLHPKRNKPVKDIKVSKASSKSKKSRKQTQDEARMIKIKNLETARQRREAAAKVVNSGSAKEVLANKDQLTTKQLSDAIQRINTETALKQLYAQQNPSTLKKIGKVINKDNINTAANLIRSTSDAIKTVNSIKKDLAEKERKRLVADALKSGDARRILQVQALLTDDEVKNVASRLKNLDSIRSRTENDTDSKPHTGSISDTINKNASKKVSDVVYDVDIPEVATKSSKETSVDRLKRAEGKVRADSWASEFKDIKNTKQSDDYFDKLVKEYTGKDTTKRQAADYSERHTMSPSNNSSNSKAFDDYFEREVRRATGLDYGTVKLADVTEKYKMTPSKNSSQSFNDYFSSEVKKKTGKDLTKVKVSDLSERYTMTPSTESTKAFDNYFENEVRRQKKG